MLQEAFHNDKLSVFFLIIQAPVGNGARKGEGEELMDSRMNK